MPKYNLLQNDFKAPSLKDLGLDSFKNDKRSAFPFKGGYKKELKD